MENRDRQMSSSLEYLPISIFYRNNYKLFLNPQTNSTKVFGEPFYKKARNKMLFTKRGKNLLFLKRIVSLCEVGVDY